MQQMSSSPWFWFLMAALAVWRVTYLLYAEDGPFDIFFRLRRGLGANFPGRFLDCFYCLSIWLAAPAAWLLGCNWQERLLLWLGLSAAAILIERVHAILILREESMNQPPFYEEGPLEKTEGGDDGMLRK
jgi:hypothetical protein